LFTLLLALGPFFSRLPLYFLFTGFSLLSASRCTVPCFSLSLLSHAPYPIFQVFPLSEFEISAQYPSVFFFFAEAAGTPFFFGPTVGV